MTRTASPERVGLDAPDYRERLRWLGQLRWWAMAGAMSGVVVATAAAWPFVSPPGIAAGVMAGVFANGILLLRTRSGRAVGPNELTLHVVVDLGTLTWLLAWAGGLRNPMSVAFAFHVVLGALLSGRQGSLVALAASLIGIGLLEGLERMGWLPVPAVEVPPQLLSIAALLLLVAALSYFALVLAERLRAERATAREGQQQAELTLQLLTSTLDELGVGIEVVGEGDEPALTNRVARRLRERLGRDDVALMTTPGRPLALRDDDGNERLYEVLRLSPSGSATSGGVIYVDRTDQRLVEERHFMLERLATLGRALQGLAHELNTPLTTMLTLSKDLQAALVELDLDDVARNDMAESIDLIVEESRRCRSLTQALLSTAHQRGPARAGETLLQIAERAARLVGHRVRDDDERLHLDESSLDVPLAVDGDRTLQVLMNLLQNALKATEDRKSTEPGAAVRVTARVDGETLKVCIADRGPGLPDEVRARLFEPFVTTRPTGEGTGLGLYTSQMIARELGGDLELVDREGGGTEAILRLPAV